MLLDKALANRLVHFHRIHIHRVIESYHKFYLQVYGYLHSKCKAFNTIYLYKDIL